MSDHRCLAASQVLPMIGVRERLLSYAVQRLPMARWLLEPLHVALTTKDDC